MGILLYRNSKHLSLTCNLLYPISCDSVDIFITYTSLCGSMYFDQIKDILVWKRNNKSFWTISLQYVHKICPTHMSWPNLDFLKGNLHLDWRKTWNERHWNGFSHHLCCLPRNNSLVCHYECCLSYLIKTLKTLLAILDVRAWSRHVKEQMDNFYQHPHFLSVLTINGLDCDHSPNGRHCSKYCCYEPFTCKLFDSFPLRLL